jgi:hypothetical protein
VNYRQKKLTPERMLNFILHTVLFQAGKIARIIGNSAM